MKIIPFEMKYFAKVLKKDYNLRMNSTSQAFIDYALQFAGASSTNERMDEYLDLLSRGCETKQVRKDMGKMSSCALFVRGLWWAFGAEHDIYKRPYRAGNAPIDVLKVGKDAGAYISGRELGKNRHPHAGDAFYIATTAGKREHFGIFTKELSMQSGAWKFETVEGGQGLGGRAIGKLNRTIFKSSNPLGAIGDRALIGWFDLSAMHLPGLRPELRENNPHK